MIWRDDTRISAHVRTAAAAVCIYCKAAVTSAGVQISIDDSIDSAMMCLVAQRYDAAYESVAKILSRDARNIDALYMLLTVEQTRLLDYESYVIDGGRVLTLADSVCVVLKEELETRRGTDSLKCLFYLGNVFGGKSILLAKCGNWFLATREALASVSLLKQVKQHDSTFYAAYLGIGVFNYYLSQNLGWIPFMGDKSVEGIRDIERATQSRFPFNYAAHNSLAWILIDRGEYARADSIVNEVLAVYPDNTIFLRIKARIALWTGRFDEAINAGRRLAGLSLARSPVNWSDVLSGYEVVAESYVKSGDTLQSSEAAAHALTFEVPVMAQKLPYVRKHLATLRMLAAHRKK